MNNKIWNGALLAIATLLVATAGLCSAGCSAAEEQEYRRITSLLERQTFQQSVKDLRAQGVSITFGKQPPYRGGRPQGVQLENNLTAINPTWRQLVDFLESDQTDSHSYIPMAYTCAEFAETLHNAAEEAGIRCAFVGIDFTSDAVMHALDGFYTVDLGWVFINSMGSEFSLALPRAIASSEPQAKDMFAGWSGDSVAFMKTGSKLGFVHISVTGSPDYAFYEGWRSRNQAFKTALDQYNRDVQSYNDWIHGRVFYRGTPEAALAESWGEELDKRKSALEQDALALGPDYNPMDVVKYIDIYF